jgi:ribose 5-phosphate isomerase A
MTRAAGARRSAPATAAQEMEKRAAAERAAGLIRPGMIVGLGSGTTASLVLGYLAARLGRGELPEVVGIPTSTTVEAKGRRLGIPLTDLQAHPVIDLTIDGADEVDPGWNLIKGGGGALLREKIVAQASRREVIVVDHTKWSPRLGTRHPLPVEVVEFGCRPEAAYLESLGAEVSLRRAGDGSPFHTDQGNLILDADFGPIDDPGTLAGRLLARAGVAEVGLFCGLTSDLIIATPAGVEHRRSHDKEQR